MVQIRRKESNAMNTSECKGAILTIVSATLLIGLNIKFYEIFEACMLIPCFLSDFLITKSLLRLSNTDSSWLLFSTLAIGGNL